MFALLNNCEEEERNGRWALLSLIIFHVSNLQIFYKTQLPVIRVNELKEK